MSNQLEELEKIVDSKINAAMQDHVTYNTKVGLVFTSILTLLILALFVHDLIMWKHLAS